MSPSENELRAALRDGEGEPLDASSIIDGAQAARARRRTQLLSVAAVVMVVAGAATGGALLAGNRDHGTAPTVDAAGSRTAGNSGSPVDQQRGRGYACPTVPTGQLISPPQSATGAAGPFFATPITKLLVCSYGTGATTADSYVQLSGAAAQAIVHSLENASKTKPSGACPDLRKSDERTLRIVGVGPDFVLEPTITTTINALPCQVTVTNGSAVRYGWTPPAAVADALAALGSSDGGAPAATLSPSTGSSGQESASPLH